MSQKMQEVIFDEYYYSIIPRPTPEETLALDRSITLNGLYEPLVVNQDGILLDGYTRYEICQNRNIPLKTRTISFENKQDEIKYVLEVNAARRQLNAFQRVELYIKIFEELREEGIKLNLTRGTDKKDHNSLLMYSELVGVGSRRTHMAIKIVQSDNEELKRQCREGIITINTAYKIVTGCPELRNNSKTAKFPTVKKMLEHFKETSTHSELLKIVKKYREQLQ